MIREDDDEEDDEEYDEDKYDPSRQTISARIQMFEAKSPRMMPVTPPGSITFTITYFG